MTIQYSDIAAYVADNTAAEIAAILQADTRHVRDVMATSGTADDTDLLDVLGEFGLLEIDEAATWKGALVGAVAAANDAALTTGFRRLLMNLQITNRPVRCGTIASFGYLVTALTGLAKQALPDSAAAIQTAMDALTGGVKYAGVTTADVQAVIDAKARDDIYTATIGPLQSKANAIATWLTTENALTMTPADYQTYADELLATSDGNPV